MHRPRSWPFRPRPKHALPDPWFRRRTVWLGVAVLVVVVVLVVRAVVSDDGGDPFVEPDFNTTSTTVATTVPPTTTTTVATTTTTLPPQCIDVANPSLLLTIAATEASAVPTVRTGWFVAKANGATWYTTADPTLDAEGELVPMNDQARTDSPSRRDLPPGDPLYDGHTDDEAEATTARECAAS